MTGDVLAPRVNGVDAVTLEVVRTGLIAIVREMSLTLSRTAHSTIIRDVRDFSCVVFDARGRLVAQAEGMPSFNGSMSFTLEAAAAKFPLTEWRPGDVVISNDPYFAGGSSFHKNDINVLTPVFHEGRLALISASKAHYLDIGGKTPGSYAPDAVDTFQEGLCMPPVKLYDQGVRNDAVLDILLANLRAPAAARGDLAAQLAAGKTAELRGIELFDRWGRGVVDAAVEGLLDHAERTVRSAIRRIPDGTYRASGLHDGDGTTQEAIKLEVAVTVADDDIVIDLAGSDPQRPSSGGNGHWHTTVAMSRETVLFLSDTSMGANEGSYRPIRVQAPEGCVFRPVFPAPTTTGSADLSVRLIELVLRALASVLPEDVIGGTFGTVSAMSLAGENPDGTPFVHFSPYAGGWGARAGADGNSAMVSILSGDNFNVPCEVMETRFPSLLAERYALRPDSAGAGRTRGGWGITYDYRTLVDVEMSVNLDHYRFPPYGIFGGEDGAPSELVVDPDSPDRRVHHQIAGVQLDAGSVVSHRTAGGGGYGDPRERDPEAVAEDVRAGLLDRRAAAEVYGVVVDDQGALDVEATKTARAA